jgi:hypothetical protein
MTALLGLLLLPAALAIPAPAPQPTVPVEAVVQEPAVTAAPLVVRNPDLIDDFGSTINSVVSGIRSDVSSIYTVISGVSIPGFLDNLPTGDDVKSQLGISNSDLDAKPTQVLNLP